MLSIDLRLRVGEHMDGGNTFLGYRGDVTLDGPQRLMKSPPNEFAAFILTDCVFACCFPRFIVSYATVDCDHFVETGFASQTNIVEYC